MENKALLTLVNYGIIRKVQIDPHGYPCIKLIPQPSGMIKIEIRHPARPLANKRDVTTFEFNPDEVQLIVDTLQTYLLTR